MGPFSWTKIVEKSGPLSWTTTFVLNTGKCKKKSGPLTWTKTVKKSGPLSWTTTLTLSPFLAPTLES